MQKFLLLRNNKQTGPYSVEELEQMGLKPYDLIWVNGRSAAWRYPGEVDELKSFAPPVEEQPYDRFYKKPTEDSQKKKEAPKVDSLNESALHANANSNGNSTGNSNGNGNGNGNSSAGLSFTPAVNPPSQKKEKEYKRVFVTLPNVPSNKKSAIEDPPVQQQPLSSVQQKVSEPIPEKFIEPIPVLPEKQKPQRVEFNVNEKKGHASIDIYYTRRGNFLSRKPFLVSAFAVGILSLVALGMFIGLSLQKPNRDAGKQETERVYRVPSNESKKPPTDSNQPNNSAIPGQSANNPTLGSDSATLATEVKKSKTTNNASLKSQLQDRQQKVTVKPIDSSLLTSAPANAEPEKKVVEKKTPNLGKLVSVSSNDFQVGPFGGISKLELTVHNTSEYALDLVIVELEYLKVNKEVFKTETLYFKDVGANSSVTVTAPKSNRGNKINYKISLITAKDKLFHASSD